MICTFEVTTDREDLKIKSTNLKSKMDIIKQQEDNCCFLFSLVELLNEFRISESIDF